MRGEMGGDRRGERRGGGGRRGDLATTGRGAELLPDTKHEKHGYEDRHPLSKLFVSGRKPTYLAQLGSLGISRRGGAFSENP